VKAEKMVNMARELIRILGIETPRLRLEWISSAEGARFAEVAREFTENVAALGPSRLKQAA
jgi:F420-non-reducing hydrogenase iron-sulfur subunit